MSETVTRQADRFEIAVDDRTAGHVAFVDADGRRVFFHTEVDEAYEGRGLARTLVKQALDATRDEGLAIVPVCPYVKRVVKKDDSWADHVSNPTPADLQAVPQGSLPEGAGPE